MALCDKVNNLFFRDRLHFYIQLTLGSGYYGTIPRFRLRAFFLADRKTSADVMPTPSGSDAGKIIPGSDARKNIRGSEADFVGK